MRMTLPSFNPASAPQGTVTNPLPQNQQVNGSYGYLLWANESSVSLVISVNNASFRIHPWELAKIDFTEPTQFVSWAQEVILSNSASAPISLCLIDAYTPDEVISAAFPIPLVRNTNVGGVVTTSIVTQLINDGNAAGTVVLETTPTGQPSSAASIDNSGNVTIRALSNSVWTALFEIISGGAGQAITRFNSTLVLDKPNAGSDVELLQLQASDASPAARWTINMTVGNSALKIVDNTNGSRALLLYTNGQIGLVNMGSLGLSGVTTFSGAASGTYTHGMTATPAAISALQNVLNATNTYGCDNIGATTVHMNVNAAPQAFVAIAVR
jgi:hypothetical protein